VNDPKAIAGGEGVILFGGSGFLGPYLLERCPKMISVGRTPAPTANRHIHVDSLENLDALEGVPFDRVIYIIGNTDHYDMEKETIPRGEPTAFDYHVIPFVRVMEQLKRYPIKKLIHFSTTLLYDENKVRLPVSESSPINPYKNRYVLSKYLTEEASKFYERWTPIITARFCNLYGPTPLERFDLIHKLIRQLLDTGKGQVWSVKPSRDFIYVEDAAEAILQLLEADYTGAVNLGTGVMTSVRRVVEILEEISGRQITDLGLDVSGPMRFQCDMTTMNRLVQWRPRFSIEEGIRRTWDRMKTWKEEKQA
jgi:nucleoside-diphosphate-sugar epimerase